MTTRIYGEEGWWLRQGERLLGSEPDPPLRLTLARLTTLTSGFALRADDEWRIALLRSEEAALAAIRRTRWPATG